MSGNTFIEGCSGITDPAEILNWYRNLYYKEPEDSEHRIMAEAIDKILPEYVKLKRESEKKKTEVTKDDLLFLLLKHEPQTCVEIEDSVDCYKLTCDNSLFEVCLEKIINEITIIRTGPCDLCGSSFYDFSANLNRGKMDIILSFICDHARYEHHIELSDTDISELKSYCKKEYLIPEEIK